MKIMAVLMRSQLLNSEIHFITLWASD